MVSIELSDKIALFPAAMLTLRLKYNIAFKIVGGNSKSNQSYQKAKALLDDIERCVDYSNFEMVHADKHLYSDLIVYLGFRGWYDLGAEVEERYGLRGPELRVERLGKVIYLDAHAFDSPFEFAKCIGQMSSCKLVPYRIGGTVSSGQKGECNPKD